MPSPLHLYMLYLIVPVSWAPELCSNRKIRKDLLVNNFGTRGRPRFRRFLQLSPVFAVSRCRIEKLLLCEWECRKEWFEDGIKKRS